MGKKRVLAGYGIDVDAVAGHINTTDGSRPNTSNVSRGSVFGARIGTKRLLDLFDKQNMKCSWYIPAHTIETFPEDMAIIRDKGHEIGCHGYTHESPGELTTQQFRDVMEKSIQILTDFCGGKRPRGFTAPYWDPHPQQISIMEELGLLYDHSFMHDDFHAYYAPKDGETHTTTDYSKDASAWMKPSITEGPSDIVVIPGSWTFDDWPAFQFEPSRPNAQGYVDPEVVEKTWRESFLYCYEHYDTFIFPMTIHPQVSGKAHIMRMHKRFIEFVNQFEGVEWCTFEYMAEEFRAGRI
ncbi:glucose 1-dehydrogenase [Ilyonectria sp. MPI-CAGE-AT-0026]|nr:glucose 1-dehydrogenase [Ilyonectria sp. MPI-CAGE-AT-0026]